jgi:spermidine synthase
MRGLKRLFAGRREGSVEVSEAGGVRTLHLGGMAVQSAMRLARPGDLELAYTRAMMAFLLFAPAPRECLMIGLGGGSIARFVHERLPSVRMTVVERYPAVVAAARTHFGLPADDARLEVVVADGAVFVPAQRAAWDVVLLDAFEDGRSVKALATTAFYAACHAALRPRGVLVANFIADEPRFGTYLARLEGVFGGRVLCLPAEDRVNMIVLALKGRGARLAITPLERAARRLGRRYGLPLERSLADLVAHNPGTRSFLSLRRACQPPLV